MSPTSTLYALLLLIALTAQSLFAGSNLTGKVNYEGPVPKARPLKMGADPICSMDHETAPTSQAVVINENMTMRYVMVSIESGLDGKKFPVPTEPAILNQEGCVYDPHVWGVRAGQKVEIRNSDNTLHNVHSLSDKNRQFNMAMPRIVKRKNHTFDQAEDIFKIKCDVHPWMSTWVGVFDHPFFSVTDDQGNFSIPELPPGKYTLRAWQEKLPAQTKEITVVDGEDLSVEFTFTPPAKK